MSIAWKIETHERMPSTQDAIKELARQGYPEGTVIQALEQTAGRGRHGRGWISRKGNLYISLLLKPAGLSRHVGQMGLLSGVAVAETVSKYVDNPDNVKLKWPNDVLLSGMKCAGILIETQLTERNALSWVAIGVGVNVLSAPYGVGTALQRFSKKDFSLTAFRTTFLSNIDRYYMLWQQEGFDPIKENWLKYAHLPGTRVKVKIGMSAEEGTFQGIDDDGNMLMTDRSLNLRKITAGEVYL